jgi:hypothetical protein
MFRGFSAVPVACGRRTGALLRKYASLLQYTPKLRPDAVPFNVSQVRAENGTCSVQALPHALLSCSGLHAWGGGDRAFHKAHCTHVTSLYYCFHHNFVTTASAGCMVAVRCCAVCKNVTSPQQQVAWISLNSIRKFDSTSFWV